jgi:hypothetical protein
MTDKPIIAHENFIASPRRKPQQKQPNRHLDQPNRPHVYALRREIEMVRLDRRVNHIGCMSPGTVDDFRNDDGPACKGLQPLALLQSISDRTYQHHGQGHRIILSSQLDVSPRGQRDAHQRQHCES